MGTTGVNLPDTSNIRLKVFTELLTQEYGSTILTSFIENLNENQRYVCDNLFEHAWINGNIEIELLTLFCEKFTAYRLLIQTGKSCFTEVISSNHFNIPQHCKERDLLLLLPAMVNLVTNRLRLRIYFPDNDLARLTIIYTDSLDSTSLLDVLFFEGFFRGFCLHWGWKELEFQVVKTTLLEKDWPPRAAIHEGIEWGAGVHEYSIKGDNLFYDREYHAGKEIEEEYSKAAQVESVLDKAAQLLKDKRELMTSVEYLHMANAELEKKIGISKKELNMAKNIQKGFVPQRIPDWKGLQFWVKYYPMTEVSGDFYDYFGYGANRLGFLVCDVSGHGVPAALITAIAKLSFNNHKLDSPAEVFTRVNLDLLNYVKQEGYLTGFYLIVDSNYNLIYSRAAGPVAIIIRSDGSLVRLDTRGTLLGMFPDANRHFEDATEKLYPGDKLFIFTDGITEGVNSKNEMFGEERTINAIKETKGMDVQQSSEYVMKVFEQFTLGTDPGDDITMLTVMLSERQEEFNRYISQAREKFHNRDYYEACEFMKKAISIFPRHTTALYLLARYLIKDKQFEEAIGYLDQYNSLQPYNADAYTMYARCSYKLGNFHLSISNLKRSLSLRSENPRALYLLGRIYIQQGDIKEAKDALNELIKFQPGGRFVKQLQDLILNLEEKSSQ